MPSLSLSTPMSTMMVLDENKDVNPMDKKDNEPWYSYVDFASCHLDCKSTFSTFQL
jgi:hypothetical protein